jgi:hypothetical protein
MKSSNLSVPTLSVVIAVLSFGLVLNQRTTRPVV